MPVPKGTRIGGRQKGTLNKATVERQAAMIIDNAKDSGRELGKDVLERMMKIAEGAAGINRPGEEILRDQKGTPILDKDKQPKKRAIGDWDRFGAWFDRTVYCAKELAKYQSPTFRAIVVNAPAQESPALAAPAHQVEDGDLSRRAERTYLRLIRGN